MMSDKIVNGNSALEPIPEWVPSVSTHTGNPTIRIVFTGLLSLCHNNNPPGGDCEVGVHNASDHLLQVKVWEDRQLVREWTGHAATIAEQSYFVYGRGPGVVPVGFYQQVSTFNRGNDDDPEDFRWIVDLENSEFYGYQGGRRRLTKVGEVIKPKVRLNTGLFHTAWKTRCEFQRQDVHARAGSIKRMGSIASYLGLDIKLGTGDSAAISLPGYSNPMATAAKTYHILFANTCDRADCVDPASSDPREQNDFFYHLATFRRNPGEPSFYLMPQGAPCTSQYDPSNEELLLPTNPPLNLKDRLISDRAPCAAAGFGDGGGLP